MDPKVFAARIAQGAALCASLAALAGALPARGATLLNVGHRGYSAAFPENTLAALHGAFDAGADRVEIDLLKAAGGEVIIFHDDTLDRTTDGTGPVVARTLAELRALDAGSWFGPQFAGERIPTLEEALLAAQGRGPLLLDQKGGLLFGAEVAAALAATGFSEELWVTAWDAAQVADAQTHLPGVEVLWTASNGPLGSSIPDYLDAQEARA